MDSLTDREIIKASDAIDRALSECNKDNRGDVAVRIVLTVRNLNDHIADKIWSELYPDNPISVNKVASRFNNVPRYRFIAIFDKYLRKSVSHFTPSEDGAERLMLKYYRYILELKKVMRECYGIEIVKNIDMFLLDTDEQTKNYYNQVAEQIVSLPQNVQASNHDNYYVNRIKPFFINQEIFYEVTLEPATEKPNKFNRITAFTKHDILPNYSVSLKFVDCYINVFGVAFPIKIISEWSVSIRPCEIDNFAQLLDMKTSIQRSNKEYSALMQYLTQEYVSLVDIIDYERQEYLNLKNEITRVSNVRKLHIFEVLDECRRISIGNQRGKNVIRYLLNRMNNRMIKDQRPDAGSVKRYAGLYLSSKCRPFDENPYSFNPKGHLSVLHDLENSVDPAEREGELIARYIENNTYQNGQLFSPKEKFKAFGTDEDIEKIIQNYNNSLYEGFRPDSEIGIYKQYLYNKGHERKILEIIAKLSLMSTGGDQITDYFCETRIKGLKELKGNDCLDDLEKETILNGLFSKSRVHFIYGAAGTGKTTLVNHISNLLQGKERLYLAKTNPAVDNMRRKISNKDNRGEFLTIDRFIKSSYYACLNFDLVVVDECSTVKNNDILAVLEKIGNAVLVLVGDTYQIEAIGYGSWFDICRNAIPEHCISELNMAHRSSDANLLNLWDEVRNMSDDNVVLERTVRNDYSHVIDDDIFQRKSNDEIILCLNYNGLYGLNNINKLLQLNNPNSAVDIGVWKFKVGDPILFNDSERFSVLYNNLKGIISKIEDRKEAVTFEIKLEIAIMKEMIDECVGLEYIGESGGKTTVSFPVYRRPPFASDADTVGNEHILPFQVAYAVSIHKSQGLEYDSVKIVIADESEERITHNIFYTAITRARKRLMIYWSPEVCNRILARIRPSKNSADYNLLKRKNNI